jgi:prenylcysteine oxidase/farnesylcysteine lyase
VAKFFKGSTTVHPYNNTAYEPEELGASIFVEVNKNLWRAVKEFDLSLKDPGFQDQAIWDGEQILLTVRFPVAVPTCNSRFITCLHKLGESSSWFDKIKFLWRYGYHSSKRTQEL